MSKGLDIDDVDIIASSLKDIVDEITWTLNYARLVNIDIDQKTKTLMLELSGRISKQIYFKESWLWK